MPEGHTVHRLARDHSTDLGGRVVRASSPQGRFADGAARIDGTLGPSEIREALPLIRRDYYALKEIVGTGLRLNIPAMGPLPLAFDLAFPVVKAQGDKVNYFNFSIGAFY